jgi:peroxiredoxin
MIGRFGSDLPGIKEPMEALTQYESMNTKHQSPRRSSVWAWDLPFLVNSVPSPVAHRGPWNVTAGGPAPDFSLESTDGGTVRLADFAGKPTVVVLARTMRTGVICPYSTIGMAELRTMTDEYEARGVQLAVVVPATLEIAQEMVEEWALPYPLLADPGLELFDAYELGYLAGVNMHGWAVLDAELRVQFLWRSIEHLESFRVPAPAELLDIAAS